MWLYELSGVGGVAVLPRNLPDCTSNWLLTANLNHALHAPVGAAKGAARQVQQATPDLSFGEDLKAGAEASDARTSAEPSFKDIGKSLNNQFGKGDATDVGKAIKDNTPSANDIKSEPHTF